MTVVVFQSIDARELKPNNGAVSKASVLRALADMVCRWISLAFPTAIHAVTGDASTRPVSGHLFPETMGQALRSENGKVVAGDRCCETFDQCRPLTQNVLILVVDLPKKRDRSLHIVGQMFNGVQVVFKKGCFSRPQVFDPHLGAVGVKCRRPPS